MPISTENNRYSEPDEREARRLAACLPQGGQGLGTLSRDKGVSLDIRDIILTASSTEDNIFRILVVLYLLLVNLIDQLPAASRGILQDKFNISIAKAIGKEGRKSRTCSVIDANNKCRTGFDSARV